VESLGVGSLYFFLDVDGLQFLLSPVNHRQQPCQHTPTGAVANLSDPAHMFRRTEFSSIRKQAINQVVERIMALALGQVGQQGVAYPGCHRF
jgi:hypothetical protein